MRAEILSIGTELLIGSTLNTNARFLSQELANHAVDVYHQVTVGDNVDRIAEAFEAALTRSDGVIATGGLGPTDDDVTVRAASQCLQLPLVRHEPTYQGMFRRLKERGYRMNRLIARQSDVPKGAAVFQNEKGTAPGILCRTSRLGKMKWILLLPGPPREMKPLFTQKALPALLRLSRAPKSFFAMKSLRLAGMPESKVAARCRDLLRLKPPVTVGIYAKPGEVELKIMSKSESAPTVASDLKRIEAVIRGRFGKSVFGENEETLSSALGRLLKRRRLTLSAAESCTGGLLGHLITETPGSSNYYAGGMVLYDNRAKRALLGISESVLRRHGAVSAAVARGMAASVRRKFAAKIGVSITGIAGPDGGSKTKPVGTVFLGLASAQRTRAVKKLFYGTRSEIKMQAAKEALEMLRRSVL